jgi:hypothetical protein
LCTHLAHAVETEGGGYGAACCQHVRHPDLFLGEGGVAAPVGVVDQSVEGLIEPLPEDHSRGGLVEGHHPSSYQHVHGHLRRHPPYHGHLLAGVRVESRVVESLGAPQLLLGDAIREGLLAPETTLQLSSRLDWTHLYLLTKLRASSSWAPVTKTFNGLVVKKKCLARPVYVSWSYRGASMSMLMSMLPPRLFTTDQVCALCANECHYFVKQIHII